MEECAICYYETPPDKFYDLSCCGNKNRVCRDCIDLLLVPLCPFCRTRMEGLPDRSDPTPPFRGAVSLDAYTLLPPMYSLNPMDDSLLDSRILRRHMKRLRKLQERERNNEQNRRINYVMNEHKRREQLRKQAKEEQDIFEMDR